MYDKRINSVQINYDNSLRELEYNIALKDKISDFKNQHIHSEYFGVLISREILKLDDKINHLDEIISNQIELAKKHSECEIYQSDLKDNIEHLEIRKIQYKKIYKNATLVVSEQKKLLPGKWYLDDLDALDEMKIFKPTVTRKCFHHGKDKKDVTHYIEPDKKDYSKVKFHYADDSSVIQDRFIIYWECDDENKTKQEPVDGFHPHDVKVAYIDASGRPICIGFEPGLIKKSKDKNGDSVFSLNTTILPRSIIEKKIDVDLHKNNRQGRFEKDKPEIMYHKYYYKEESVIFNRNSEILLYPLDQVSFTTKPLHEIGKIKVESDGVASLKMNKATYEVGDEKAPSKIFLHCTLMEWNARLREKLEELKQQINEYKFVCHSHALNLQILQDMEGILDNHIRYPYIEDENNFRYGYGSHSKVNIKKIKHDKAVENRRQFKSKIKSLREGIEVLIENPPSSSAMESQYNDIKRASGPLWGLLQSKSLRKELEKYVGHAKNHIDKGYSVEGLMPPGPYMQKEGGWERIFITIAECYEALSYTKEYREKVWRYDILNGIELYDNFDAENDEVHAEAINVIDRLLGTEHIDYESYLIDQRDDLDMKAIASDMASNSLFGLIVAEYGSIAKPYLSYTIPGPGAPCILQVVLSCYQTEVFEHLNNNLKNNKITSHIRFYINVLKEFGVFHKGGILSKDRVFSLMMALVITKNTDIKTKRNLKRTKDAIFDFLENIDGDLRDNQSGKGQKPMKEFWGKFIWDYENNAKITRTHRVTSFAKVAYTVFNFAYSIQELNALAERARENGWSEKKIMLTYMEYSLSYAMGVGSVTNTTLNTLRLLSNESHRVSKLLSSNVVLSTQGIISNILDTSAVFLSVIQMVNSAEDTIKHINDGRSSEAVLSGLNTLANYMITSGYVFQREFVKRTLFTFLLPWFGGALVLIGTGISLALLIYEVNLLIRAWTRTEEQKKLEKLVEEFKQKKNLELDRYTMKHFNLSIRSINVNFFDFFVNIKYDENIELETAYKEEALSLYDKHWAKKESPVEYITKKYNGLPSESGSIRLTYLSWKAVIPLYLKLLNSPKGDKKYERHEIIEELSKSVKIPISYKERNFSERIKSVEDIIDFYDFAKNSVRDTKSVSVYRDNTLVPICDLLELGAFTVLEDDVFLMHHKWKSRVFMEDY